MGMSPVKAKVEYVDFGKSGDGIPPEIHFSATDDQRKVFSAFARMLNEEMFHSRSVILAGYAGTGKTWLAAHLIRFAAIHKKLRVAICAPTHKAAAVLAEKMRSARTAGGKTGNASQQESRVPTLHSLLGLKLKENHDGTMRVELDRHEKGGYFEDYDVVFIDEASMVGNVLLAHIREFQQYGKQPLVVYVGDPGQLMPVEPESAETSIGPLFGAGTVAHRIPPVFLSVKDQHTLTEIVRQKGTDRPHPIAFFAQEIRHYIEGAKPGVFSPSAVRAFLDEHKDYMDEAVHTTTAERLGPVAVRLRQRFPQKETRIVTWRNMVVDDRNQYVHEQLGDMYGVSGDASLQVPFWPGEILVARDAMYAFRPGADILHRGAKTWEEALSPDPEAVAAQQNQDVGGKTKGSGGRREDIATMVPNNTEMTTVSCRSVRHPYLDMDSWMVVASIPGEGNVEFFLPADKRQYQRMVRETWDIYKNTVRRYRNSFRQAWAISRACAPVMHAYAMTAHKSQGSTFHYSLVDLQDLFGMVRKSGANEYHRAFYVAVTRASERIWLALD